MKSFCSFSIALFCVLIGGCSASSNPSSNNNNNGGNTAGVIGPSVGSVYLTTTTEMDSNKNALQRPTFDTILVINNTLTFGGRTNVMQTRDRIYDPNLPGVYNDTNYYGYDAAGDFYIYDKIYPGWRHYPVGSKMRDSSDRGPTSFGTTTLYQLISTCTFVGTEASKVNGVALPVLRAFEEYDQNQLQIHIPRDLFYAPSIKFMAYQRDTRIKLSAQQNEINPIITAVTLLSDTLK